mgnify:CR=1 FL=1
MITGTSLLKNGRVTGPLPSVKDLVKNKIVHAITASRYWSSSENSQNNSWNVNFSNGNFNNNNKYNSNMVRAVAAFQPSPSLLTGEAKSNDCLHSDEALINMLRERGYKGELTKTLTI